MEIALSTTVALMGATFAAAGMLLLLSWAQHRAFTALGLWGVMFVLGAIGTALLAGRGKIPPIFSIAVANVFIAVAYGMMWNGARRFEGRRPMLVASMAGLVLWLLALLIPGFCDSAISRATLMTAIGVAYSLLAAFEIWRGRAVELNSRWPVIGLFVVHAIMMPVRIPLVSDVDGASPLHSNLMLFVVFETIMLALAGAYLLGSLARENETSRYKRDASVDALTGVANRRKFLQQGERMFQRAERDGTSLALLLFDLDHFKSINDAFGHAVGDEVLKSFCTLAATQLRPGDLLGRLGGEEFACVISDTTPEGAVVAAERIRSEVWSTTQHAGAQTFSVTVSIGVAVSGPEKPDLAALIVRADRALYRAKDLGRNRVALSEAAPRTVTARDEPVFGARTA